jgi:hypothetical protein
MNITAKLQLKPGTAVSILALPEGVALDLANETIKATEPDNAAAVIAFVTNSSELDSTAAPVIRAARDDRLAWIAYPKAGKLNTDLSRDVLARLALDRGIQPVRQIAIDETWSALRFRPDS